MIVYKCLNRVLTGIVFIVLSGYPASAQNTLDQTLTNLQKQVAANPFEKVYLHMDKPYYGAGDTIWFKGYTVTGAEHRLSGISGILNVELINSHNYITQSIKLPMVAGLSYGDFVLPDTLTEGGYRIRAWTNWMRNMGPDYFFDQTISIINAAANKVFTKAGYSYTGQNTNAHISYTDIDGKPYSGKEIKYEVRQDNKTITSGSGITDEKGILNISFINKTPGSSPERIITKIKPDDKKQVVKEVAIPANTSIDVQFFPEGGYLVNGVANKLAFKAVGSDGLGKDLKGIITDNQNNEIAPFSTSHLGMGAFMFAPENGKAYTAKITYPDGTTGTAALPKAKDEGYIMAIKNAGPVNIAVRITSINTTEPFTLVAQAGGEVCYEAKGLPGKPVFLTSIPKSKFPPGIIKFTLFSSSGEPLNERILFVPNTNMLNLAVTTAQQTYAPRQKVKVDITSKDNNGKPVIANLSASVINESELPVDETTESTILSNLLLTSDLKGYIEKPNYYFTNVNSKTNNDLDVLMLTQGYNRYEWKKVMNNEMPQITYQPEKDLTISGKVMMLWGKPDADNKVFLISKLGGFPIDTLTDKNGRFKFNNLAFRDSLNFIIKTPTEGDKDNVKIELDNTIPQVANKNRPQLALTAGIDSGLNTYLKVSKEVYDDEMKYGIGGRAHLLKEVNINRVREKSARQKEIETATLYSDNLNGKGAADQVITADDLETFGGATLADILNGRLAGVQFDYVPGSSGQNLLVPFLERRISQKTSGANAVPIPMLIVLDGMVLFAGPPPPPKTSPNDMTNSGGAGPPPAWETVENIPASHIESIEVLRSIEYLAAYGSRGGSGVIVITTKHGGQEHVIGEKPPGILNFTANGYYKAHKFYSPKYDTPVVDALIPDFRTTIYWKPIIQTDKEGNASLEYFNGDRKGTYRIIVEGIDNAGHIGRQVYRYKVE